MHTRTFRLFVSSTFSDFTEERKLLQTVVFPRIKDYCKEKKLVFQPIDLRWGVTDEASNDQKTLELCLDEVQTSKLHPYPNFLIMMGDRYGTVILPYLIEKNEFETILNHIESEDDKNLLTTWYRLDENQIPASYIIKQRKDAKESIDGIDYTNRANWKPINNRLLNILQNTVSNIDIKKNDKKKYFASATEAEIIEGIFKYLEKTKFQQKLLGNDTQVESYDYEHVYAYIRNIKHIDNVDLKNKLQDDDSTSVAFVKEELKRSLAQENIYSVECDLTNTVQDENGKLNYYYKELNDGEINFVSKMTEYLKRSIDKFLEEVELAIGGKSDEQIKIFNEKIEQKKFKDARVKDFLEGSRTIALQKIDDYINGDNNQPLVIYGRSGLGKSSLLAKAIDNILKVKDKKNVVYRFVGATSSLNDSRSLLISILKELGINEEIKKVTNPQTGQEENEKIEDFYFRVHEYFVNINQVEKILFIDAVDQLTNEDEFLWLPQELPSNFKIVISALEDDSYPDDSKYFESLKVKTDNLYPLEPFEDSKKLVENTLARYDRTLTDEQMDYLLSQPDFNSPLYLTVAAQVIRHWKSHGSRESQVLAPTQKEIINEYIENLTKLFHHDKEFVKRVFSYIYLTDGLSESELLEILNTDKDFISQIAPDTYHKKETPELPIVIWARLHFQIKEFLKINKVNGWMYNHEIMVLEKEIQEEVKQNISDKLIHETLLNSIYKLIEKYHEVRYGEIYVELLVKYNMDYSDEYKFQGYMSKLAQIKGTTAVVEVSTMDSSVKQSALEENKNKSQELWDKMTSIMGDYGSDKFHNILINSCNQKALHISIDDTKKSLVYSKICCELSRQQYEREIDENEITFYTVSIKTVKNKWADIYTANLHNLSYFYEKDGDLNSSLKYINKAIEVIENLYLVDPKKWAEKYLSSLQHLEHVKSDGFNLNEIRNKKIELLDLLYKINEERWAEIYFHELMLSTKEEIADFINLSQLDLEKILAFTYGSNALNVILNTKKSLKIANNYKSGNWVKHKAQALKNLGTYYHSMLLMHNAEYFFILLKNFCEKNDLIDTRFYTYSLKQIEGNIIDMEDILDDPKNYALSIYNQASQQFDNNSLKVVQFIDLFSLVINIIEENKLEDVMPNLYCPSLNQLSSSYIVAYNEENDISTLENSLYFINKSIKLMESDNSYNNNIDIFRTYIVALSHRSMIYQLLGNKDESIEHLKKALAILEKNSLFNNNEFNEIYLDLLKRLQSMFDIEHNILDIYNTLYKFYQVSEEDYALGTLIAFNNIIKDIYSKEQVSSVIDFIHQALELSFEIVSKYLPFQNDEGMSNMYLSVLSNSVHIFLKYSEVASAYSVTKKIENFVLENNINSPEVNHFISDTLEYISHLQNPFNTLDKQLGINTDNKSNLLMAIEDDNVEYIKDILLFSNLDLNFVIDEELDPSEWATPLTKAVQSGNLEIVELLLQNGAKIETIDLEPNGTVLFDAVINNDIQMIKLLLEYGADIHQEAAWGGSPYDYAKSHSQTEIIELFEQYENKKQSQTKKYQKPLTTLLLIAKGLSIKYNNANNIRVDELYNALHSVDLSSETESIFRQLFGDEAIDNLSKDTDGFELIKLAENHPKIKYDESLKDVVDQLKSIFGDDLILNVRELYIPEYDINDDEIPF